MVKLKKKKRTYFENAFIANFINFKSIRFRLSLVMHFSNENRNFRVKTEFSDRNPVFRSKDKF